VTETYSTTKSNALNSLEAPISRETFERGEEVIEWVCNCSFHETDTQGGGILFACEEHSGKEKRRDQA